MLWPQCHELWKKSQSLSEQHRHHLNIFGWCRSKKMSTKLWRLRESSVIGCSYSFGWLYCRYWYKWKGNRLQICKIKYSLVFFSWFLQFFMKGILWLKKDETFVTIFRHCAFLLTLRHNYHFLCHLCRHIRWRWNRCHFSNHFGICSPDFGKLQRKTDSILKCENQRSKLEYLKFEWSLRLEPLALALAASSISEAKEVVNNRHKIPENTIE